MNLCMGKTKRSVMEAVVFTVNIVINKTVVCTKFHNYKEIRNIVASFVWTEWSIYTGCPRRNVPDFGRVFLMLKYTDITQTLIIQTLKWAIEPDTVLMQQEILNQHTDMFNPFKLGMTLETIHIERLMQAYIYNTLHFPLYELAYESFCS
jgi:hypothetical protein